MQIVMTMALLAAGAADGVVLQPVANMYSRPSDEADVVSQAIYASHIGIIEERAGWARVRTADEYTGWMPSAVFKRLGHGERLYASSGRVAQLASLFANMLSRAEHYQTPAAPYRPFRDGTRSGPGS